MQWTNIHIEYAIKLMLKLSKAVNWKECNRQYIKQSAHHQPTSLDLARTQYVQIGSYFE